MCASACHAMPMVDGLWKGCAPTTHVCVMAHVCASLRTPRERDVLKNVCRAVCVNHCDSELCTICISYQVLIFCVCVLI